MVPFRSAPKCATTKSLLSTNGLAAGSVSLGDTEEGAVRADDERAYVDYVTERQVWIRRLAFRLCGDWDRAEDLAQHVCVRLYVHWQKARKADSIDAYVRTIVVHAWLDEQARGWFRRVISVAAVPERPTRPADPEHRLDLLDALAEIAPGQRVVLVLRYWEQLSVSETAAVLRCSEGTVKSQTARGLASLRARLSGYANTRVEERTS